ncbi:MAG: NAD(P)-dependent glycerol-3-phosphate dehydrogenase [Acidobacteriota bacterium]|nr:NAD(P)-dependent glycerol-3-phosphate dehydrogenase [Acidobacteriota bacterium]
MSDLAIVGAGSWGTALAIVLAPRCRAIRLWVHRADQAELMRSTRRNDLYLPGLTLPPNVEIRTDLEGCLQGAEAVLGVMPSHVARGLYREMLPWLTPKTLLISATKGLENGTLLRISEIIQSVAGERFRPGIAVLSGPTFAREVAEGSPTALVIASEDAELGRFIQNWFSGPTFRLYTSCDPAGVEIGGSLKNVIAIGAGVCAGLQLGRNTMAALIARGLAEITRLALALGGQRATLAGLAGLGDLILTCTGELSRNRQVGLELAKGRSIGDIVPGMRMVAEGIRTTSAAFELARRHGIDVPIVEQMHAVLDGGRPPAEALRQLMERSLKGE